jgi:hypothetical protein
MLNCGFLKLDVDSSAPRRLSINSFLCREPNAPSGICVENWKKGKCPCKNNMVIGKPPQYDISDEKGTNPWMEDDE